MAAIILILLVIRFFIWIIPDAEKFVQYLYGQLKQKFSRNKQAPIFESNYIEVKAFYVKEYNATPCISFINNLDVTKAYEYINSGLAGKVLAIYQRNYYSWQYKRQEFSTTVFKLGNKVMIELGDEYAEILFSNNNYEYANRLMQVFSGYKAPEKEARFEINIITQSNSGLDLKQLEIKPTSLDINLYYNDDFKPVDEVIKQRLEKENDKGIILLHGLPGTGKTTYLRHLIGNMKKRVLFVSPGVAGNLMNPEFIDLLIDNPNAVLVIEDAENIIMDRKFSSNSSVSNLLNISDGLLSDCLNVQIICTFNSALSTVDSALLRKGRLIAKYEFGKLGIEKSKRLSTHLGFNNVITQPMTIAEIANPHEQEHKVERTEVMGFRRQEMMMN
jgi:ATPase family associated with various cellular activities (AAA)